MSTASDLDLAVIGNCQVAALIDRHGRIVWMCLPKPDADPVFCALLRREGGDSVSGVFAVDQLDQGLAGLATTQGLSVTYLTPYLVLLR